MREFLSEFRGFIILPRTGVKRAVLVLPSPLKRTENLPNSRHSTKV
jgi:hypothetical protein